MFKLFKTSTGSKLYPIVIALVWWLGFIAIASTPNLSLLVRALLSLIALPGAIYYGLLVYGFIEAIIVYQDKTITDPIQVITPFDRNIWWLKFSYRATYLTAMAILVTTTILTPILKPVNGIVGLICSISALIAIISCIIILKMTEAKILRDRWLLNHIKNCN